VNVIAIFCRCKDAFLFPLPSFLNEVIQCIRWSWRVEGLGSANEKTRSVEGTRLIRFVSFAALWLMLVR
jgi:hypothetical protein